MTPVFIGALARLRCHPCNAKLSKVENELSAVTPAEMVDAFVHPPQLVPVGQRGETESGQVLVVSLLELWPWRVVARLLRANGELPANEPFLEAVPDSNGSGAAVIRVVKAGLEETELRRSEMAWLQQWRLADDIGTNYRMSRAGSSGGGVWTDCEIEFQPDAPALAQILTLTTPDGEVIDARRSR